MTLTSCPREAELRDLLAHGQWPQAAAPDLRTHATTCRSCGDLVLVTESFRQARASAIAVARLGSPGVLWWRAQLRRRNAAVERITRPLLGAQIFALAVTLLSGFGFAVYEARHGIDWFGWFQQLAQSTATHWDQFRDTGALDPTWGVMVVLPAIATLALLTGVAVYLATDRQ
jgi:hypothetical protein